MRSLLLALVVVGLIPTAGYGQSTAAPPPPVQVTKAASETDVARVLGKVYWAEVQLRKLAPRIAAVASDSSETAKKEHVLLTARKMALEAISREYGKRLGELVGDESEIAEVIGKLAQEVVAPTPSPPAAPAVAIPTAKP